MFIESNELSKYDYIKSLRVMLKNIESKIKSTQKDLIKTDQETTRNLIEGFLSSKEVKDLENIEKRLDCSFQGADFYFFIESFREINSSIKRFELDYSFFDDTEDSINVRITKRMNRALMDVNILVYLLKFPKMTIKLFVHFMNYLDKKGQFSNNGGWRKHFHIQMNKNSELIY